MPEKSTGLWLYPDKLTGQELIAQIKEFEPNVPIVSFSQIMSLDRCGFQWHLSYVEKWRTKKDPNYMVLGRLGHENLAVWYSTHSREAVQQKFVEHYSQYADNGTESLEMLAEEAWLVMRYIDDFAPSNDSELEPLAVEEHFLIELYTPSGKKFYLQGYIDVRAMVKGNQVWLGDHKFTSKTFLSPVEAMIDPQLVYYAAARNWWGEKVFGVFFNQLNTYQYKKKEGVTPEQLFRREYVYLQPKQLDNILEEVGRAVDELIEIRDAHTVPRKRLRRDCKMCRYSEACLMQMRGVPIESVLQADFKRENQQEEEEENDDLLDISL